MVLAIILLLIVYAVAIWARIRIDSLKCPECNKPVLLETGTEGLKNYPKNVFTVKKKSNKYNKVLKTDFFKRGATLLFLRTAY